jgi:hypothetical protein
MNIAAIDIANHEFIAMKNKPNANRAKGGTNRSLIDEPCNEASEHFTLSVLYIRLE